MLVVCLHRCGEKFRIVRELTVCYQIYGINRAQENMVLIGSAVRAYIFLLNLLTNMF